MTFDPTLSIGGLLQLGVLLVVVIGAFWRLRLDVAKEIATLRERLGVLESKVGDLWNDWLENGKKKK